MRDKSVYLMDRCRYLKRRVGVKRGPECGERVGHVINGMGGKGFYKKERESRLNRVVRQGEEVGERLKKFQEGNLKVRRGHRTRDR